ncbi:MAG: transporter substrate-binding domain-containing protein, partial [Dongiaceae bacterium]
AGLTGFAATALPAATDEPALTILFHVRPPYSEYDAAHLPSGLLVAPVEAALAKAGLGATWIEMPPVRQTEEIKRSSAAVCGLGWFKRPEREAFALFSQPIYRDQPPVVVARKDDDRFADEVSLEASFRDTSRELLVKTGYSYGATIDDWIKELQPRAETSSGANDVLLGMVAFKRADYAIMAPEEADRLLSTEPELGKALRAVPLSDAPAGEPRYLMCSKATPPDIIERINQGLPAITAQ